MAKTISADGYTFRFGDDVVDAFVFDSKEHHGGMNAMPKGIPADSRWVRPIVKNVAVVNVATWNASEKLNRYGSCSVA